MLNSYKMCFIKSHIGRLISLISETVSLWRLNDIVSIPLPSTTWQVLGEFVRKWMGTGLWHRGRTLAWHPTHVQSPVLWSPSLTTKLVGKEVENNWIASAHCVSRDYACSAEFKPTTSCAACEKYDINFCHCPSPVDAPHCLGVLSSSQLLADGCDVSLQLFLQTQFSLKTKKFFNHFKSFY